MALKQSQKPWATTLAEDDEVIAGVGYDPGRAMKPLPSMDHGMQFVQQFEPWRDFFPGYPLELEPDVVVPDELS